MNKILKVHNVNDYARYIGAPVLHPHISVIHYDELEHCRHSLNSYDVYGIFIADQRMEALSYGQLQYDMPQHTLMCVSPGQIGGKTDTGEEIQAEGWALLFSPDLLNGRELGRRMSSYTYFTYNVSETLALDDRQRDTLVRLLEEMRTELLQPEQDGHTVNIVVAQLALVLEYIARFYSRQMQVSFSQHPDLLRRLETLLDHYYKEGKQHVKGLPTVRYCAQELFLSPNYFGDLVKELTGDSATVFLRRFLMARANEMLAAGHTVGEVSDALGFSYPQHFSRVYKRHFGVAPSQAGSRFSGSSRPENG